MSARSFFRLRFPPHAALCLSTTQGDYQVCELSEGGLRIACAERCDLRIGQLITGEIAFHDGSRAVVKGHALRRDHRELVVTQIEGIRFEQMMAEQRYVLQNFPVSVVPQTLTDTPAAPTSS